MKPGFANCWNQLIEKLSAQSNVDSDFLTSFRIFFNGGPEDADKRYRSTAWYRRKQD